MTTRARNAVVVLAAASLAAGVGCGSSGDDTKTKSGIGGHRPAARVAPGAARRTTRVVVRSIGHLPAPVQLPAVAPLAPAGALVMGGLDAADGSSSAIVRVQGRRAGVAGHLPVALHDAAGAAVGARLFFIGGGNAGAGSPDVLRVSPGGQTSRVASLPRPASDVSAATVDGAAYVVGGYTGTTPLDTIVRLRADGHPQVVGHLPRALRYAAVAPAGRALVVVGGSYGTTASDQVVRFDPASSSVKVIAHLPASLTHAAAVGIGGMVYVLGGRGPSLNSAKSTILSINPTTGRVRRAGHLPQAMSDMGAASLGSRALVFGGRDAHGGTHDEIWSVSLVTTSDPPRAAKHKRAARVSSVGTLVRGRIPALVDPHDVYAADRPIDLSPVARRARAYVYVPNSQSNTVDVVSQRTGHIVGHFAVGALPQHVVPSWDLKRLWVTNDIGNSLTPVNPDTGLPGKPVSVEDPYNMYFTADGRYAIVVEERNRILAFRDARTMRMHHRLLVPQCGGVDHMDFTADGRKALVSCEFAGRMIVVDLVHERVLKSIQLSGFAMPQDVKLSPDGRTFYVADMASNGVWLIDAHKMRKIRFMHTGSGAHGLYPSRDDKTLYVSNRGEGSISLIDFRTRRVRAKWHLPGGGSPDMGGVSADGRMLWLSGRYNGVVYAISTRTGRLLRRIRVGAGPHGLCVWPQPGRYSIGHTGILR